MKPINIFHSQNKNIVTAYDTDAEAYFTTTGITNTTIKNSVNTLVTTLKSYNIWSKGKLINPLAGGTSSTNKINLKDPRDLDAAYRLSFSGTVTHSSNGMQGNGSNGYANTFLNANTVYPSGYMSIGIYSRTNTDGVKVDIGALSATNRYLQIYSKFGNTFYGQVNTNNSISENVQNYEESIGWFFANRSTNTNSFIQKNSTINQFTVTTTATVNNNIYVMAQNNGGSPSFFSDRQIAFIWIGDSLTTTEAQNLNTAVSNYISNLTGASAPVVNAGIDQYITQPTSSVTLIGSATDTDGTISSYLWSKESGPSATITSPTNSTTTITGMSSTGTYVFKLTATDNSGLTGFDTVNVIVSADGSQQISTTTNSWNTLIHLPDDYASNPTTYYPTIIFFPGLGEIGTDASKLLVYGPNRYIQDGWDGNVTIGGTTTKYIVISLQPPAGYPTETLIDTRIQTLKSNYRIGTLFLTGPSMGGWCAGTYITGDPYGGPFYYASQIKAIVSVEGVVPDDNQPFPNLFDNFADVGGRYVGFEQSQDNRQMPIIVNRLNSRVANSGIYVQTNFGNGGHGYFEQFYGQVGVTPATFTLDGINQNLYEWLTRQI